MCILTWSRFARQGEITHHAVLHRLDPGVVQPMHTHRFTEVFWGLEGECVHTINGEQTLLSAGELVLLRSRDRHELRSEGDAPFLYYLVSFPNRLFRALKKRYFPAGEDLWGEAGPSPLRYKMPALLCEWMNAAVHDLIGNPDDVLAIERFLVNLLFEIRRLREEPDYACPEWLRTTLTQARDPEQFCRGPRVLAELSGRSYEHVSRTLKAHSGLTPSAWMNRIRIEYAAAQLVLTDEPIASIAFRCGFRSLGRFYLLFKNACGLPPRQYRLRHRRIIPA